MPDKGRRHSGGRPSHDEAIKRDERLIEIAASMFMERGFEGTSIDAVAEAASIGKATLYARYKDKSELFAAVLQRQIDRWLAMHETGEQATVSYTHLPRLAVASAFTRPPSRSRPAVITAGPARW